MLMKLTRLFYQARKTWDKKIIVHSHTTSYGSGVKNKIRFLNEQINIKIYADFAFACSKKQHCGNSVQ